MALREILTELHVAGQRVDGPTTTKRNVAFVGPKDLKSWIREEFKSIIMLIKCKTKFGIINLEGNSFGQRLNDYATLKNRHKHMTIGLDMVGPNLKCNLGILLDIARVEYGSDNVGHEKISKMFKERVGFESD